MVEIRNVGAEMELGPSRYPRKLDETPRVTEIKVRESFEKQLGISNERANVMLLTAVHRLPGGMDENKRNCIVCFSSLMDRDEVLQKGIALKPGSGYSVVPDLPPSVSILRISTQPPKMLLSNTFGIIQR